MKYKTVLASFALGSLLVSPLTTFASGDFCASIEGAGPSSVTSKIDARKEKISLKAEERSAKLTSHFDEMESRMNEKESLFESKKAEMFSSLDEKADTDEETSAVETFKNSINEASGTRSSSIDSAFETYKNAVTSLGEDRSAEIDAVVSTFEASVDSAIDEARSSCEAGTPANEVRAEFKSDMDVAKDALANSIEGFSGVRDDIKALHDTFVESVKSANETFKNAVLSAKETLKDSLGEAGA